MNIMNLSFKKLKDQVDKDFILALDDFKLKKLVDDLMISLNKKYVRDMCKHPVAIANVSRLAVEMLGVKERLARDLIAERLSIQIDLYLKKWKQCPPT